MSQFEIRWFDTGREPTQPPNPAYPDGVSFDISKGANLSCLVDLPYPARRIGAYSIRCERCGLKVSVTTAGRPDDPRSVRLACKASGRELPGAP